MPTFLLIFLTPEGSQTFSGVDPFLAVMLAAEVACATPDSVAVTCINESDGEVAWQYIPAPRLRSRLKHPGLQFPSNKAAA